MAVAAPPLRLAHRGDWRAAPENSIAALLAALERPACDGLEFDVRLSSDGVPVVIHDETLERVQGRPERVDALPARALEDLGVPALADVLIAIGRRPFLDVELKGDPGRAAVEVLAAGRGPGLERAVVSSFERGTLEGIARLAPTWRRWLNSHTLDAATIADARLARLQRRRRRVAGARPWLGPAGHGRRPGGRLVDRQPAPDVRPAGGDSAWSRCASKGLCSTQ